MTCEGCLALQDLRQRIEALEQKAASISREDRELLSRLLPSLGGAFGSEPFFVWQAADDSVITESGLDAAAVGSLLSRATKSGTDFAGYVVRRTGTKHGAARWKILRRAG